MEWYNERGNVVGKNQNGMGAGLWETLEEGSYVSPGQQIYYVGVAWDIYCC